MEEVKHKKDVRRYTAHYETLRASGLSHSKALTQMARDRGAFAKKKTVEGLMNLGYAQERAEKLIEIQEVRGYVKLGEDEV